MRKTRNWALALALVFAGWISPASANYCVVDLVMRMAHESIEEAHTKNQRTQMWMDWFPDDRNLGVMPKTYYSENYRMFTISGEEATQSFLSRLDAGAARILSYGDSNVAYYVATILGVGGTVSYSVDYPRGAAALGALATMALLTKLKTIVVPDQRLLLIAELRERISHFHAIGAGTARIPRAHFVLSLPEAKGQLSLMLAARRVGEVPQIFVLTPTNP